eukprot:jgi/Mesvir1/372/Mv11268-RA.1
MTVPDEMPSNPATGKDQEAEEEVAAAKPTPEKHRMALAEPRMPFKETVDSQSSLRKRYRFVKDIGAGGQGVACLVRDRNTNTLYAVKFIGRGRAIDQNVRREINNHRQLHHPNIVWFKEVLLTKTHLAILMEYAGGGELYGLLVRTGAMPEDQARYFFQQLISGVRYCHSMNICHRDLKLENTLLDTSHPPKIKICDFGYSKSSSFDSIPDSKVGTAAYVAPEVIMSKNYDGKVADVWSCGVLLYIMLVGRYPFEDPEDKFNDIKTIQRAVQVQYSWPADCRLSAEAKDLIGRIFKADPAQRITMDQLMHNPWFLRDMPPDIDEPSDEYTSTIASHLQSLDEINAILDAASRLPEGVARDSIGAKPKGFRTARVGMDSDLWSTPTASGKTINTNRGAGSKHKRGHHHYQSPDPSSHKRGGVVPAMQPGSSQTGLDSATSSGSDSYGSDGDTNADESGRPSSDVIDKVVGPPAAEVNKAQEAPRVAVTTKRPSTSEGKKDVSVAPGAKPGGASVPAAKPGAGDGKKADHITLEKYPSEIRQMDVDAVLLEQKETPKPRSRVLCCFGGR